MSHSRLSVFFALAALLTIPGLTAAGTLTSICEEDYYPLWDNDQPFVVGENSTSDFDRFIEFDNGVTCANGYNGNTPVIELDGSFTLDDNIISSPNAGTNGSNAFPILDDDLIIDGTGLSILRDEQATTEYRFFQVNQNGDLTLRNINLYYGKLTSLGSQGGAIRNEGTLRFDNATVSDAQANIGGGIYNDGTFTIENDSIIQNSTATLGGGIYHVGGDIDMDDSVIQINSASIHGGNIHKSSSGDLTIVESQIYSGTAGSNGGGIYNVAGTATIINTAFEGDVADMNGGAIYNTATMTAINNTLIQNTATNGTGSAIYNDGSLNMTNNSVVDNVAANGASVALAGGSLTFINNLVADTFSGNDFEQSGGSLTLDGGNLVQDGTLSGTGVLSGDPNLDPDGNIEPLPDSIAVHAGDSSLLPPDTQDLDDDGDTSEPLPLDRDEELRVQGPDVDLGAIEIESVSVAINQTNDSQIEGDTGSTDITGVSLTVSDGILSTNESIEFNISGQYLRDDYTQVSNVVNIPADDYTTPQTIDIPTIAINGDTVVERDNDMTLTLENPSILNLQIVDSSGNAVTDTSTTYTIINDDEAAITVSDDTVTEGDTLSFTLTLDNETATGFMLSYKLENITTETSDFVGSDQPSGSFTFSGVNNEQETINIDTTQDDIPSDDETAQITLTGISEPYNVDISDTGTGTIENDDSGTVLSMYDVNNDNRIAPADAVYVINRIGDDPDVDDNAPADVNQNGTINSTDVQAVIDRFGNLTD